MPHFIHFDIMVLTQVVDLIVQKTNTDDNFKTRFKYNPKQPEVHVPVCVNKFALTKTLNTIRRHLPEQEFVPGPGSVRTVHSTEKKLFSHEIQVVFLIYTML